jgi:hypothetical protein
MSAFSRHCATTISGGRPATPGGIRAKHDAGSR